MWLFSEEAVPALITFLLLVEVIVFHLVFPFRDKENQHDYSKDSIDTRRSNCDHQTQTLRIFDPSRLDQQT